MAVRPYIIDDIDIEIRALMRKHGISDLNTAWIKDFSWKQRISSPSGDKFQFVQAYRNVGTGEWLNKKDYLVHLLTQE